MYEHTLVGPLMATGAVGVNLTTAKVLGDLLPQFETAATVIVPILKLLPYLTSNDLVPCPLIIVAPVGTVHV